MIFTYEYRTPDNEKCAASISAASHEDVYAKLKVRGIRPFNVRLAPGLLNRLRALGKRWLAIAVLAVVCAALAVSLAVFQFKQSNNQTIKQSASSPRHQLYGDPVLVADLESSAFATVFSHPGERFLAYYAQPGRRVVLPKSFPRPSADVVVSSLTNEIVIADSDSREVVELKQMVNGLKDEMREYVAEAPAADYLRQLDERQHEEAQIHERVRNELNENPSLREERNRTLRDLGLPTVSRTEFFSR